MERGKNKSYKWLVIEINQDLKSNDTSVGGGGLALYLVLWLAMCSLETAVFKWMPQQSTHMSGTYTTEKKTKTVRAYSTL